MKVTCEVLNGRTYVDVLDLLVAIDSAHGDTISKEGLKKNLLFLNEQGQEAVRNHQKRWC